MPWVITPAIVYWSEGRRIVDQLRAEGLDVDLTPEQVAELARASLGPPKRWVDRVPELTPEGRAVLDRLAAQNREQARASIAEGERRRVFCRDHGHRHAANESCPQDQDQRPTPERGPGQGRGGGGRGTLPLPPDQDQARVEGEGRPARVDQLQDLVPNPAQTAPDDVPLNSPKIREMGKSDINRRGADQHSVARRSRNGAGQTSRTGCGVRDQEDDDWRQL